MPKLAQQTVTSGDATRTTAVILSGVAVSSAVYVGGKLVGIEIPVAWTAAAITFQGSVLGTTFIDIWDSALTATAVERTVVSGNVPTAATRFLSLSLNDWTPFNYIIVRSGTSASPVNQGADRTLGLVLAG